MINKLKIGLLSLAALSLVLVGTSQASAAAGDLTWSAAQTVDLSSPDMDLTIASGSTAESLVVNAGTIVPTLASGDVFTVSTAAAGDFSVSPITGVIITCPSTTFASVTITAAAGQAYTITPSATACSYTAPGGGSGGAVAPSGATTSAVAQATTPVTIQVTPTETMVTTDPGCSGSNKYSTSTGKLCVNNALTPGTTLGKTYNFGTKTLKNGSRGEAAKELQRFLNAKLNLGLDVDGIIGPKTIAVIKKWQKDNGLVVDGLIGPKTKAKMNAK